MKCIELLGMSRAGKTTQIAALVDAVKQGGAQVFSTGRPMVSFRDFTSPARFHNYYIDHLAQTIGQHKEADVVILDRGFYDRLVLADFDHDSGLITEEDYATIRGRIQQNLPRVDLGFLLLLSPEESLRRFESQKAQGLDFSHLNEGMIDCDESQNLANLYGRYVALATDPKLHVIDAGKRPTDTSRDILRRIYEHK